MTNPVEVTPEYIAAVMEHRRGLSGYLDNWKPNEHLRAILIGDIAALLTHLHANPRVPSDEEVEQIRQAVQLRFVPEALDVTAYWREWAVEFQRHQFAPRKADVPDVVNILLDQYRDGGMRNNPVVVAPEKLAVQAFRLGIQFCKDGK